MRKQRKKAETVLAAILPALTFALAACDRNSSDEAVTGSQPRSAASAAQGDRRLDRSHSGEPLPAFTFSDPAGKQLNVAALKGQPVLINLWATWCGPCVAEMPTLDQLAASNRGTVRVVTIAQDEATAPVVQYFAQHLFRFLEPWLDPKGDIDLHYNTGRLPTTVYYDAQGREVWRYVGSRDWTDADTAPMLVEGTLR